MPAFLVDVIARVVVRSNALDEEELANDVAARIAEGVSRSEDLLGLELEVTLLPEDLQAEPPDQRDSSGDEEASENATEGSDS